MEKENGVKFRINFMPGIHIKSLFVVQKDLNKEWILYFGQRNSRCDVVPRSWFSPLYREGVREQVSKESLGFFLQQVEGTINSFQGCLGERKYFVYERWSWSWTTQIRFIFKKKNGTDLSSPEWILTKDQLDFLDVKNFLRLWKQHIGGEIHNSPPSFCIKK